MKYNEDLMNLYNRVNGKEGIDITISNDSSLKIQYLMVTIGDYTFYVKWSYLSDYTVDVLNRYMSSLSGMEVGYGKSIKEAFEVYLAHMFNYYKVQVTARTFDTYVNKKESKESYDLYIKSVTDHMSFMYQIGNYV